MQNKLYGRAFADVGIVQEYFDDEPQFVVSEPGIQYRLNYETLNQYGIGDAFVEDFIEQLTNLGTIEEIRAKIGLEPRQGAKQIGLVLKHREMPHVIANVLVNAGPIVGFNPNLYAPQWDIMLNCYIDVEVLARPNSDEEDQDELNMIMALSNGGIGRHATDDIDDEEYKSEEIEDDEPVDESEAFYEQLIHKGAYLRTEDF